MPGHGQVENLPPRGGSRWQSREIRSRPYLSANGADDPPQSGDVLAVTWQTMWGDAEGRLERYRLYDGRNPAEPRRIFVWERATTWGWAEYR